MKFEIPTSMKAEHDELHTALAQATKVGGQTGEAAKAVAIVLHAHFVKEEEYALPPLGLLAALAHGNFERGMADVLTLTDKLATQLPQMLAEHKQIVAALEKMIAAAKAEQQPAIVDFAEKLMLHAQMEEQVAYPTALLIGRYVRAALAVSCSLSGALQAVHGSNGDVPALVSQAAHTKIMRRRAPAPSPRVTNYTGCRG